MLEAIHFKNYRCFSDTQIAGFKQITLISGKNNVGKSALLEGIFLFAGYRSADIFPTLNNFRGLNFFIPHSKFLWEHLFTNMNSNKELEIYCEEDGEPSSLSLVADQSYLTAVNKAPSTFNYQVQTIGAMLSSPLKITFKNPRVVETGYFFIGQNGINLQFAPAASAGLEQSEKKKIIASYIGPRTNDNPNVLSEQFGVVELGKKKHLLINSLKILDNRLTNLSVIVLGGTPCLYASLENGVQIPVKSMGDGMNRFLNILLAVTSLPNSILLVDEIETGFHYSMYKPLWAAVTKTAIENNCQIIATTHSHECLEGAAESIKNNRLEDRFSYIRLGNENDKIVPHILTGNLLEYALDANMEVR